MREICPAVCACVERKERVHYSSSFSFARTVQNPDSHLYSNTSMRKTHCYKHCITSCGLNPTAVSTPSPNYCDAVSLELLPSISLIVSLSKESILWHKLWYNIYTDILRIFCILITVFFNLFWALRLATFTFFLSVVAITHSTCGLV